jgi:hypothetical protein
MQMRLIAACLPFWKEGGVEFPVDAKQVNKITFWGPEPLSLVPLATPVTCRIGTQHESTAANKVSNTRVVKDYVE